MTDHEINTAIAEHLGIPTMTDGWVPSYNDPCNSGMHPEAEPLPIPDFANDLNAMHEAEKCIPWNARGSYAYKLGELMLNDSGRGWQPLCNDDYCFHIAHATARQRAEALVWMIGVMKQPCRP